MRVATIVLAVLLLFPAALSAGEKLYLTRTLKLDFKRPGRIVNNGGSGTKPVSEKTLANSYELVLPEKVTLKLSIAGDNPRREHYKIRVNIKDETAGSGETTKLLKPDRVIHIMWLASYRYQFTFIRKHASPNGRFISAVVKLDVYAPEE